MQATSQETALPTFGEYDLVRKIADGGMGSVYEGRHRATDTTVAIKILKFPPRAANRDELVQRFVQECRIARTLELAADAKGRKLEVIRIPGVGLYRNALGGVSPASHLNFVIANGVVVMPVYGTPTQDAALEALQAVFPDRSVIGVPSRGLLGAGDAGGGSFHCITQHEPL